MVLCFLGFLAGVVTCLVTGWSMLWAVLWGLVLFSCLGLKRGYPARDMAAVAWKKGRESFVVVSVFLIIGIVTALWRSSGTIAFFLYYGLQGIQPQSFLLVAYLLTLVLSFLLGSSFGVIGTAGVALITLARSGGVDPALTAGAIISGAFFGDRCSTMSSSAALVATVTDTDLYHNVKLMLKTGALPTAVTGAFFLFMSLRNPISAVDESVLRMLEEQFSLHWIVLLPAVLVLALPLLKIRVRTALLASAFTALVISVGLQGMPLKEAFLTALRGYRAVPLLSGGGLSSVFTSAAMVLVIGFYVGVLEKIEVLRPMQQKLDHLADRIGLFPTTIVASLAVLMIFCNQSVMILMGEELLSEPYRRHGATRQELAIDLENSGIVMAGLVPWNIAVTVPLSMLDIGREALLWCVFLYMVPLCYLATRSLFRGVVAPERGGV